MTAFELGLRLVKQAKKLSDTPNVVEGAKTVNDYLGPTDVALRVPDLTQRSAQDIVDAMSSASRYNVLDNIRVGLGSNSLKDFGERLHANPRVWNLVKNMTKKDVDGLGALDPSKMGDFYSYRSQDVNLPSRNPGLLVHELGHAIDFNEYPADSNLRGLIGGTYRRFAPVLWKEHAAWNKGRDRFLEGAAQKKLDPKFVQDVLQSVEQYRPAGLGSYWGGRLGALGGLGLGAAATAAIANTTKIIPYPLIPVLGGLGTALGITAGTNLGKYFGHAKERADDKARMRYLKTYADAVAKKHGISPEEAMQELTNAMNKKQKSKNAA